jgi:hypothetical protein
MMVKYARVCDITGEGMNEGFCILNGEMYIKNEEDLLNHLREQDFSFEDEQGNKIDVNAYEDEELMEWAYNDEYYYYTEWE